VDDDQSIAYQIVMRNPNLFVLVRNGRCIATHTQLEYLFYIGRGASQGNLQSWIFTKKNKVTIAFIV
jgi:hypothetical protein